MPGFAMATNLRIGNFVLFLPRPAFISDKTGMVWPKGVPLNGTNQYVQSGLRFSKKVRKWALGAESSHHYQDFQTDYFQAGGGDFLTDAFSFNNLSAANDFSNGLGTVNSRRTTHQISRVGGELSLEYDNKYALRGIVSREGSSILGELNNWGTFYGGMASAQVSENLSLRSSFAVTGNLPSGRLLTQQILQPVGPVFYNQGMFTSSYVVTQLANPNLQWEATQEFTLGVDFRLWEGRLTGSLDYYRSQAGQLIKKAGGARRKCLAIHRSVSKPRSRQ